MNNNTHRNQQLIRDRLFLEKIFLLDIEQRREATVTDLTSSLEHLGEQSNDSNNAQLSDENAVLASSRKRTTAPMSLVSIYAIVVTLLLLLPSNRNRANGKTILKDVVPLWYTASHIVVDQDQERVKLLETKLQQLEAKTQILASEIAANSEQKSFSIVETVEPATSSFEQPSRQSRFANPDNSTQRTTYQLPPLPVPTPPAIALQTLSQPESLDATNKFQPESQLTLLPVLALPSFTQTFAQPALEDASAIDKLQHQLPSAPPVMKPEIDLSLQIETKEESLFATAEEEVEQPAEQWLGQTNVVYYSHSFNRQEESAAEQQQSDTTLENTTEQSLFADEDLKQYLISTPLSIDTEETDGEQLFNSDSQDTDQLNQSLLDDESDESLVELELVNSSDIELNQQQSVISDNEDLAQYLDSTPLFDDESKSQTELLSTASNSVESQEPSLFDDQDLARYLNSAPLLDDEILQQKLGKSPSTDSEAQDQADESETATIEAEERTRADVRRLSSNGGFGMLWDAADKNSESIEQPSSEKVQQSSITANHIEPETKQPLFADEDLKQFLTSTPLLSDDILKEKLK